MGVGAEVEAPDWVWTSGLGMLRIELSIPKEPGAPMGHPPLSLDAVALRPPSLIESKEGTVHGEAGHPAVMQVSKLKPETGAALQQTLYAKSRMAFGHE